MSIPGLYSLVCCGQAQAGKESHHTGWTGCMNEQATQSQLVRTVQGLNKCLWLPALALVVWGAASWTCKKHSWCLDGVGSM